VAGRAGHGAFARHRGAVVRQAIVRGGLIERDAERPIHPGVIVGRPEVDLAVAGAARGGREGRVTDVVAAVLGGVVFHHAHAEGHQHLTAGGPVVGAHRLGDLGPEGLHPRPGHGTGAAVLARDGPLGLVAHVDAPEVRVVAVSVEEGRHVVGDIRVDVGVAVHHGAPASVVHVGLVGTEMVERHQRGHDVHLVGLGRGEEIVQVGPMGRGRAGNVPRRADVDTHIAVARDPDAGGVHPVAVEGRVMRTPKSAVIGATKIVPVVPRGVDPRDPDAFRTVAFVELGAADGEDVLAGGLKGGSAQKYEEG